jgi:hypothetical protein
MKALIQLELPPSMSVHAPEGTGLGINVITGLVGIVY